MRPVKHLRVIAPHFSAGIEAGEGGKASPVLSRMLGWSEEAIREYCVARGWTVLEVPRGDYEVYCDGASRKDGRGGWGFIVYVDDEEFFHGYGGHSKTTNNRMELMAAIEALRAVPPGSNLKVFCDSQYVVKGITEYVDDWIFRDWRTSGNKEVKNKDLWETLAWLDVDRGVEWVWVRGHSGNTGNERADELAGLGIPEKKHGIERHAAQP